MNKIIDLSAARAVSGLDEQLLRSDKGVVLSCVSNLILIIGRDPELAPLCGYDEFRCMNVLHRAAPGPLDGPPQPGPYPRAWTQADVSHVQSYIQRIWVPRASRQDTEDAMVAVCATKRFHPVRDWLDGLKWDGTPRLDLWLNKAFGAPDTDYHASVASCFLIAAVRRVRRPGVKFDHMPILEGDQGKGKSTAVKTLFGEQFFTDSLPAALDSKDAALGLQGVWLVEFAEIEQIIRTEVEVIKAFLSRSVDRFRAPYGRTFLTYPRQSVMIGTTNDRDYLRDPTGNRRFWPVWCEFVEVQWIAQNREQLWAEAAAREASGEDHWIRETDAQSQAVDAQNSRQQEDVWEDKIAEYLGWNTETTTAAVLSAGLGIPVHQQGRREQIRVAGILKRMGRKQFVTKNGTRSVRVWKEG